MTVLAHPGRAGTGLTGTGELARLAARRDRIALAASVYVITAGVAGTAYTFKKLYPTAAGRAALAATGGGNPALRFLYGTAGRLLAGLPHHLAVRDLGRHLRRAGGDLRRDQAHQDRRGGRPSGAGRLRGRGTAGGPGRRDW